MQVAMIINLVFGLLTLVEKGVVTFGAAKQVLQQARDEDWRQEQWTAKLAELAQVSDDMFADTQELLNAIASGDSREAT